MYSIVRITRTIGSCARGGSLPSARCPSRKLYELRAQEEQSKARAGAHFGTFHATRSIMNTETERREPASGAAVDGLAKLREILFGGSQRELERRMGRAELHLTARASELEQEIRRRLEVLESHMAKETEAITARLERDAVERGDQLRAITREHRESATALEQRVAKVEEAILHTQRELRQELLAQAKSFLDELHDIRREFAEMLEPELGRELGAPEETGHGDEERPSH